MELNKPTNLYLRHQKPNRRKVLIEVINQRFQERKKQAIEVGRSPCLFRFDKAEDNSNSNFASHDIDKCRAYEYKNSSILEQGSQLKEGSISSLNLEWDNQGR